jgi:hypothetical protein
MGFFDDDSGRKRTLGVRDRQILYRNANGRCENPACGKKMDYDEMEVGHRVAYSKGGTITLRTAKSLCHRCNKLQGTDSWETFLKKQGVTDLRAETKAQTKASLERMTLDELKQLAKKHGIKVKGRIEEGFFSDTVKAPTKTDYVKQLSKTLTEAQLKKHR